jgi:hypothetical protein
LHKNHAIFGSVLKSVLDIVEGIAVPVHAIKAYGEAEVQLHLFLTSALNGGEWLASGPGLFTSGKQQPLHTAE